MALKISLDWSLFWERLKRFCGLKNEAYERWKWDDRRISNRGVSRLAHCVSRRKSHITARVTEEVLGKEKAGQL
jgi:hypothetical protein